MYVGIVGLALPIGVISSNFADVYAAHFDALDAAAEQEENELDEMLPESVKAKPIKQVQPASQKIAIIPDDEGKEETRTLKSESRMPQAQQHPLGSITASIAMLQSKFQELGEIKKEWDEVMGEVETLIL
jgi:hypothetical protein